MRISDWSSDVCSSDLIDVTLHLRDLGGVVGEVAGARADHRAAGPGLRRRERDQAGRGGQPAQTQRAAQFDAIGAAFACGIETRDAVDTDFEAYCHSLPSSCPPATDTIIGFDN